MHERRRGGLGAASPANAGSQPDIDPPSTPAAESFSQSRRENMGGVIGPSPRKEQANRKSAGARPRWCTVPFGRAERQNAVEPTPPQKTNGETGNHRAFVGSCRMP